MRENARWDDGRYAWEVREVAILILTDLDAASSAEVLDGIHAEAMQWIVHLKESKAQPLSEFGRVYVQDPLRLPSRHLRRQCEAAIVAHDTKWLWEDPPSVSRPRHFYPERAPETPRPPEDSEDSETSKDWVEERFFRGSGSCLYLVDSDSEQ